MTYIYAGFISYAHADEAVAARLHRALETYKIPKGHTGTLSPIFRDTTELTAHHSLSDQIRNAVTGSRVLIVLCSPAAKLSHWVNEEIRLFREIHGEAAILCVLADGTPDTAFPPALLEGGREPLAANLGSSKESFRLGVTQIAAAMLGVGLDTLIQRDTRRKRRRLQAVTAAALMFSTAMGVTTFSAVTAQKAAEANRMQAEGLVEYMITDLKEKLEPVGRLDILDGIGQRAVEYYDAQDISKLPDDSLARQARSRHILGQVALDGRDFDRAREEIEAAARLTKEVYDRNPDNTEAIFAHAQSEYWVGEAFKWNGDYESALPHWQTYAELSEILFEKDSSNFDWIMESAWGSNNVALAFRELGDPEIAEKYYLKAIRFFELAVSIEPDNLQPKYELANVLAGVARVKISTGSKEEALSLTTRQIDILEACLEEHPNNYRCRFRYVLAKSRLVTDRVLDADKTEEVMEASFVDYENLLKYDFDNRKWKYEYYYYLKDLLSLIEQGEIKYSKTDRLELRFTELSIEIESW